MRQRPSNIPDMIEVHNGPASWHLRAIAAKLIKRLRARHDLPPHDAVVLSISCVGRRQMTQLNRRYRRQNSPTDILSFEQPGRRGRGIVLLGDLVLCKDVVRAQAKAQGHGVRDELSVLLAHGLLHLLGYDHERSQREALKMARAEGDLLKAEMEKLQKPGLIQRTRIRKTP